MKLIIDIPEDEYKVIRQYGDISPNKTHSLAMEIINGTPIPDNATNGDVIKTILPYIEVENHGLITSVKGLDCDKGALDPYRQFWSEWWNAPYQKGGKE